MTESLEPNLDAGSRRRGKAGVKGSKPAPESAAASASDIRRAWVLTAAVAVGIIFLSTRPNLHPGPGVPHLDKVAHFVEYALLSWFATAALRLSGVAAGPAAILAFAGAASFGMFDEWIQSFVPGRVSCAADWAADSLGAMAGAVFRILWDSRRASAARRRQTRGETIQE